MRGAHPIKGAARIVNLEAAVRLAHAMEDTLVAAQQGRIRLGPADIDVLLRGTDVLAGLAQVTEATAADWSAHNSPAVAAVVEHLEAVAQGKLPAPAPDKAVVPPAAGADQDVPLPRAPAAPNTGSLGNVARTQEAEGAALVVSGKPREETPGVAAESAEAVVRVTAQSLNRLMGLAGESLVQARWLGPFATALQKLKKQ